MRCHSVILSAQIDTKIAACASSKSLPLDYQSWTSSLAFSVTLWVCVHLLDVCCFFLTCYGLLICSCQWAKSYLKNVLRWRCGNHRHCSNTEPEKDTFKKCSKCNWVRYCSRECQVTHWKEDHKNRCGVELTKADMTRHRIMVGADDDEEDSNQSSTNNKSGKSKSNK